MLWGGEEEDFDEKDDGGFGGVGGKEERASVLKR